jgi:hypothetical protein
MINGKAVEKGEPLFAQIEAAVTIDKASPVIAGVIAKSGIVVDFQYGVDLFMQYRHGLNRFYGSNVGTVGEKAIADAGFVDVGGLIYYDFLRNGSIPHKRKIFLFLFIIFMQAKEFTAIIPQIFKSFY